MDLENIDPEVWEELYDNPRPSWVLFWLLAWWLLT